MISRPLTAALAALAMAAGTLAGTTPAGASPVATLLAPAIPEAPPAERPRGAFFTATLDLALPAQVRLAGTSDGAGELCTDDEVEVSLRGPGGQPQLWGHLFAAPDRRGIECIPAQTIDLAGGPGRYTVTITLTDRFADTFSSGGYYLLPEPAAALQPAVESRRPTAAPLASTAAPTATAPQEAPPAPTVAPATSSPPTARPPAAPAPPAGPPAWPMWAGAGLALLALTLLPALLRRRRRAPGLSGIVDLADRETGETCTLLLHQHPRGAAIARRPLALLPPGSTVPPIAAILPGAGGPVLEHAEPGEGSRRTPLRGGDHLLIQGAVELRFRHTR